MNKDKGKLKINEPGYREDVVWALINSGYKVWVEKEKINSPHALYNHYVIYEKIKKNGKQKNNYRRR